MKRYTIAILCSIISVGCAANNQEVLKELSASDEQIRREVEELKRHMAAPSVPLHKGTADSLKEHLQSLRQEYARQISGLERRNEEQEREISQLRVLMARLETNAESPPQKERSSESLAIFRPGGYDVPSAYRAALEEFRAERVDRAAGMFAEILAVSPENDLADNAQYWLGECHYDQRDFPRAVAAFRRVLTYPETEKSDDAQLKIAYCHEKMGDSEAALRALGKLLREYPRSEYAEQARTAVARLRTGR